MKLLFKALKHPIFHSIMLILWIYLGTAKFIDGDYKILIPIGLFMFFHVTALLVYYSERRKTKEESK